MNKVSLKEVVGGGYNEFWNDKRRYRALKGGKGSKKSSTTALNLIYRIMKYPGSNALVVRAVMQTHRDSTFAALSWAQNKLKVSHLWKNSVSPMQMIYIPTGQKIIFRGFDDVLKLASTTVEVGYLNFVWIEEAYEITSEADFEKLDLSVPRGKVPEGLFKQTTLTFNPWSEQHWLKSRFFDEPADNVGTYTTNYLCNEWLDSTDHELFEQMKKQSYSRYKVAGLGEWGVSEGLVYENYEIKAFEVDKLGIEFDEKGKVLSDESYKWRSFFGLDYGYTNDPTAFIAFAANPIDKVIYVYDEFYQCKMLNSDIANEIKRRGYAKERIRADAAEPKSNDDLKRLGINRILPSVKGKDSILNGISFLQEYKIYISPACKNTISEISGYCFEKDKGDKLTNRPKDINNHLMDALRYAAYDIRFFRPTITDKKKTQNRSVYAQGVNIVDDMLGGWE
jgi:phage terminase large subunit